MNHLGKDKVKHPYVFDKGLATHLVTAVLYGAQAFFVFDRDVSEKENCQDIQGKFKMMIDKIPSIAVGGKGSLKLEDKDRANVENFSCRFYGDFSLQKTPLSFQDAVEVYQSLPKLLGANGENAVPMKVWLLPLTILDYSAAKLVHQINLRFVQDAQRVLEELGELEIRCNDALRTITVQQFPQIGEKLRGFKESCCGFKLQFQKDLAKKLPSIRGGGEEETVLAEIVNRRHFSPFNNRNLSEWMNCKEREIYTLTSFTNTMKNTMIVPSQNHLYKESFRVELVCFVFTSLGSPDLYLSALSEYLKGRTKPDDPQHPHTHDVEEGQWYSSKEALDEVRSKAKLFSDFAEANKENQNIKFLTVGLKDEKQKGSSIYLYKDGFSVSENFEPPSKPETVTVSDINHNCVTLKVSPPRFGAENISSYSVEYCVSGEDGWQRKTASTPGEVTVSDLRLNTEYMFRSRAVTSVGVGPANEVSGSIKTLPCSPPGKPKVEADSTEISVSWEKPAELGQDVHILSYMVEYATTDNRVKEEDLEWKQMVSTVEHVIISGLQPKTEYVVRVRCDCGEVGRSKEHVSVNVCTKKCSHLAEVLRCTSNRIHSEFPSVYKLPLNKEMYNEGYQRYTFGKESLRQNRSIVLSGSTRSGKSTLINGMINYIVGVEWKDNFRFRIVDENQSRSPAESVTSDVAVYKINHQDGFKVPFSLTVVDIPDVGETRCIERHKKILEQLCRLFSVEHSISEIDAVCFVVQTALAELTPTQKDLFDAVRSIFDRDVTQNVRVLVTFTDGQLLPVLEAINASGVPCPKRDDGLPVHFKFNNSALFARNKSSGANNTASDDDTDEDVSFEEMLWERGTKRMKRFFGALNVMDTKSLTLTKEVLRERQQLENSVEQLQEQVKVGFAKLQEINETIQKLNKHEAEICRNKIFEFEVTVTKPVQVDVSSTEDFFTNCQQCHMTCHYPHGDDGKTGCATLGSDGRCTVCPGKCYWNVHFIQKFRWDHKNVTDKQKVKELKEKYLKAAEALTEKLRAEHDLVHIELKNQLENSADVLNRLKEEAQKPDPLTTSEYVDLLIEGEKSEGKPGWKQRVRYLKEILPLRKLFKRFFQIPQSKGRDLSE
ncbi:Neoverrucotoxin subunit alpha [Channa argus]|uniref:Neoverrucotoxin subunit alpha n=1 Tax=Channa argus TaxID=215402 RepID=A0A6G1Q7Z7_CHAAH|nr:Neoverrucotoxin subunit alpha [Channa argus]